MRILILILFSVIAFPSIHAGKNQAHNSPIRIACVGNSVTYGYGLDDREHESYPVQLGIMLGQGYDVRNFGLSGATVLPSGRLPYIQSEEFRQALAFKADKVIIHLGLNDTDPRNWPNYRDDFIPAYRALIDSFRVVNPNADIYVCKLTPIFERHHRFESGTRDWESQIQDAIDKIAKGANAKVIDLHSPLYTRCDLFADALHPNSEGAVIMARTVFSAVTGNYGGLRMPVTFSDNMVLQRQKEISVEGCADASDVVSVRLVDKNKLIAADKETADFYGHWSVSLPVMEAGGPYRLCISTKKQSIEYDNVWIGEVWVVSGQSNMTFKVSQQMSAADDIREAECCSRLHFFRMRERYLTNDTEWTEDQLDTVNRLMYLDCSSGWQMCSSKTSAEFSAIGYHFGRLLSDSLKCHVGIIQNAVGGSPAESWISRNTLEWQYPQILRDWLENDHIQQWVRERAKRNIHARIAEGLPPHTLHGLYRDANLCRHPYQPAYMYEAGILPIKGYGVRGIVWYQGESNAHNAELHERLFPMLVNDMREAFGNTDMPFLFVQLSSLNRPSWPYFRNSQRKLAEKMQNVWMSVSSDYGDSLNVHPEIKKPIGERLVKSALNHVYGRRDIVPSGPEPIRAVSERAGTAEIEYSFSEGLHSADGGELVTHEVAGEDGIFHKAKAEVRKKNGRDIVCLTCPEVAVPCEVRYGWQPFTRANLVNSSGLPCSTYCIEIEKQ